LCICVVVCCVVVLLCVVLLCVVVLCLLCVVVLCCCVLCCCVLCCCVLCCVVFDNCNKRFEQVRDLISVSRYNMSGSVVILVKCLNSVIPCCC